MLGDVAVRVSDHHWTRPGIMLEPRLFRLIRAYLGASACHDGSVPDNTGDHIGTSAIMSMPDIMLGCLRQMAVTELSKLRFTGLLACVATEASSPCRKSMKGCFGCICQP